MKPNSFTFTDNRGMRQHVMNLDSAQLAEHLANDPQFMFYWRKGLDPRLAATRSLYAYPPSEIAHVAPNITEEQWPEIDAALRAIKS